MRAGPPARFSSGENYAALEHRQIEAYIPLFGRYIPVRDPFTYEPEKDQYRCTHGAILRNHGLKMAGECGSYHYIANFSACQNCRFGDPTHQGKLLWKTGSQITQCDHVLSGV